MPLEPIIISLIIFFYGWAILGCTQGDGLLAYPLAHGKTLTSKILINENNVKNWNHWLSF